MANLRLISFTVNDSTSLSVKFNYSLSPLISVENIIISSQTIGISDPLVLKVLINDNTLNIITQPLVPGAAYITSFSSTENILFKSINGNATILNDGINNKYLFIGLVGDGNPIKNSLLSFFKNSVYDFENPSILSKYIDGISSLLSKALYNIGQTKNDNYLSFTVKDELKTRGNGAYDRLNQEGAYEVIRVAETITGTTLSEIIEIDSFPSFPVSLLSTNMVDTLSISNSDTKNSFNIKTLTLNCSKSPLIILNGITFVYNSVLSPFNYNVSTLGYQIQESQYDPEHAFTYVSLNSNQFKLNDAILQNPLFSLENIASITVDYQYKNTGKIIDATTLQLDSVISSGRETLPAIENIFNLNYAPIVKTNNLLGEVGSVSFIDPNAYPGSNTPHPAFLYEVIFRFDYLPSRVGEYSIDYTTGTVYVFGEDINKTGTGAFPPLALYSYRHTFQSEIDYVYDEIECDLISLPNGSLNESDVLISYDFENVLIKNIDYKSEVHKEELSERIDNRLLALNILQPLQSPITNVFRIFNETSGEIYRIARWNDNKIFFNYQNPPKINDIINERASFDQIINETLFISTTTQININKKLFKIFLLNNNIISLSEDGVGFSQNSSLFFSDTTIFTNQLYYDTSLTEIQNNTKLNNIGDFQVDYQNGIIWVIVSSNQDLSIGTASYKRGYIFTNNKHIITVDDLYYKLNTLSDKIRSFNYISFTDNLILPQSFDRADEEMLNGNLYFPYQVFDENIGVFDQATFIPGVSDYVKYIRGIFEREDLINNISPINFSQSATFNGKTISVSGINYSEYQTVQLDGSDLIVNTNINLPYISTNIIITPIITRLSDSVNLWDGYGSIEPGSPFRFVLSGTGSPGLGDAVLVNYTISINDLSRVVVDYSRGDYLIDYSYLADEIILSYEWGDNIIDFSQSTTVENGDQYYVSYKVGALRDALLNNFGTLIDIPILNNLNIDFVRERYRDALMAAMQSFTQGPTITSLKNIVEGITHSPPEIIESNFTNWSLGNSLLSTEKIKILGNPEILPGKYGNGILISEPDQTLSFPVSSNLKIEEGTLEMWVVPQWKGIDNQSNLTFEIIQDGYSLSDQKIFIGQGEDHPISINGIFSVNNISVGIPNKNKDGIYIYLDTDNSGLFNRWYVDIVDGYSDGYVSDLLSIKISTNGKMYDVKKSTSSISSNGILTSGINSISYKLTNPAFINEGITFTADYEHFLFDFGKTIKNNRFSIYRDASGYLNYRVIDSNGNSFIVDADVSSWNPGEQHHIAVSWVLNSKGKEDEMHLFIDGIEISNIIKYGSEVSALLHQKFRTISSEDIIGSITKNIVGSTDLISTVSSNQVSSSINFTSLGINIGDTLYIDESGFNTSGYSITNVNGNILSLSVGMPLSATQCRFSVNKTSLIVDSQINLYKNIAASVIHSVITGTDLITTATNNTVSSPSINFQTSSVVVGNLLRILVGGFEDYYIITGISGHTLTLSDAMPSNTSGSNFLIYSTEETELPGQNALVPSYEINRDSNFNNVLTIKSGAHKNDIVLIRTLGLNHGRVRNKYYLWGNTSNILNTRLPSPLLLEDVNIFHTILNTTVVGPNNSTLSLGIFTSNHILTDQPSNSDNGRTLSISIDGDNINYSTSVSVVIHGTINGVVASTETIIFSENETKNTVGKISLVNYIVVICKPINSTKNCCTIKIIENKPITVAENSVSVPVIRYSYQMLVGNTLSGTSGTFKVSDTENKFSNENIGNYLIIYSPAPVAGQYLITDVSDDLSNITINTSLSSTFSNGNYEILNVSQARSGLQNGKFTFEEASTPGEPYQLTQGMYELDYHTGLSIPLKDDGFKAFIGSDLNGNNQSKVIIDDFRILNIKLSDTRIGETTISGQDSITKHFNSLKPVAKNINTLILLDLETDTPENNTDTYLTSTKDFIQSSSSVNDNFNKSISFTNTPLVVDNKGILNTKTEGTIEFWVNSLVDAGNDPNYRFYFDASGVITEEIVSINNATVVISGRASEILNVKLTNNEDLDYFAGGVLTDDNQTLILNNKLPNQNTPVVVSYIPTGVSGDRISIYKDPSGYINFTINGSGISHQVRAPIFWPQNTWHRLKAQYTINQGIRTDEMRLFIDGYEQGNILFGNGLLFGEHLVFGSSFVGHNDLNTSILFTDTINEFSIGSDYTNTFGAQALIDNLRISNISRPIFKPFGESIDVGYSTNIDIVFPTTEDLYTTLLLDFNKLIVKTADFAVLKNKKTGLFDITVNVYDSFGILEDNSKSKTVMETLLNTLKPAGSRLLVNYK